MACCETEIEVVTVPEIRSFPPTPRREIMKRILKTASVLALVAGLGIGGIAITSTPAEARICWTENTDYEPGMIEYDCFGGNCSEGWCCLICT